MNAMQIKRGQPFDSGLEQPSQNEPHGSETIACFPTRPLRTPIPYSERQIVERAIENATQDARHKQLCRAFRNAGIELEVREINETTHTAQDAADALGCTISNIMKSIVLRCTKDDTAIIVLLRGSDLIDETSVSAKVSSPVEKPSAEWVKKMTGFSIGGIPPVGHISPLLTFLDQSICGEKEMWVAAGTPHRVAKVEIQKFLSGFNIQVGNFARAK